ncbi:MAG: hypothetical protein HUU08_14480 [Candidatus Brocadia sp.]|nr:hypothetical protein [Candidatus Brocadia sp.]
MAKIRTRLKASRAVGVMMAGRTGYSRTIFRHARRNSTGWAVKCKWKATLFIQKLPASTIPNKEG